MQDDAPKRILIVEDDYVASMLLEFNLKKFGFDVLVARDGEIAWQVLQIAGPVDLVITDEQMPNVSGIELCRKMRACDVLLDVPVIMLTCKAWEMNTPEIKELFGLVSVIEKPFSPRNLFGLVQDVLFPDTVCDGELPVFTDLPPNESLTLSLF